MKILELPTVDDQDLPPEIRQQIQNLRACSEALFENCNTAWELIAQLQDEIAVLKGEKKRPLFKPSRMNEEAGKADPARGDPEGGRAKRPGSDKKSKTGQLKIHQDCVIQPDQPVPPDSRFKGYHDFVVQDLVITANNTRYPKNRS